jgi:hypothetical protein
LGDDWINFSLVINTPDGDASADWTKGSIDLAELVDPADLLAKRDAKFFRPWTPYSSIIRPPMTIGT